MRARLYLDAVRHARARQLAGRARRLLPPAVLAAGLRDEPAPSLAAHAAGLTTSAVPQTGPVPAPHDGGSFRAYGATRQWGSDTFWSDTSDGLLFLFHLHGFEALAHYAAGAAQRTAAGDAFWRSVVEDWLDHHRRPARPAWHPYPTSLRLIAFAAAAPVLDWPQSTRRAVAAAVLRQARYLARTVEHDIGGNHVVKNATALVVAGTATGHAGTLRRGRHELRRAVARQLLADGGHEERSASYHREVLHDLGTAAHVLERAGHGEPPWLATARSTARGWLAALAGPDGTLPLLNDAWEGPPLSDRRPGERVTVLHESGYAVLRDGDDQLVFDAGPLSPPHLPPHAHADALSFVLWLDGRPLVVDPGSHLYTGPTRNAFRGTRAHNTVAVDGADQCRFWGDFRLAHPPRVRMHEPRITGPALVLGGEHDGYQRLPDGVRHTRHVVWWPPRGVVVVDRLTGTGEHDVISSLHLAPAIAPQPDGDGRWRAGPAVISALGALPAQRDAGEYAPFLGVRQPIAALRLAGRVTPGAPFGWSLLRPGAQVLRLDADTIDLGGDGETLTVPLT